MELNLVTEGLKFMVLGMVTVFLFLILLVIVLKLQAKIINKFFPQKAAPSSISRAPIAQQLEPKNNKALVAAITAAITTFKNSKEVK
jgi:oxaloacetate decarboxylase gamma subunit